MWVSGRAVDGVVGLAEAQVRRDVECLVCSSNSPQSHELVGCEVRRESEEAEMEAYVWRHEIYADGGSGFATVSAATAAAARICSQEARQRSLRRTEHKCLDLAHFRFLSQNKRSIWASFSGWLLFTFGELPFAAAASACTELPTHSGRRDGAELQQSAGPPACLDVCCAEIDQEWGSGIAICSPEAFYFYRLFCC